MSRLANTPIEIPQGVDVALSGANLITIKGSKGTLQRKVHSAVKVLHKSNQVTFASNNGVGLDVALVGTTRALVATMVQGVNKGVERKLILVGVGYRAQVQGKLLNLTLGFSHPVAFAIPEGILIETPSQTEVVIKGIDKQLVGQVAANIRNYRPPEPYKGKGIRYSDEKISLKEAKKK